MQGFGLSCLTTILRGQWGWKEEGRNLNAYSLSQCSQRTLGFTDVRSAPQQLGWQSNRQVGLRPVRLRWFATLDRVFLGLWLENTAKAWITFFSDVFMDGNDAFVLATSDRARAVSRSVSKPAR